MSEGLRITKKGRLIKKDWVYDEEKDEGQYVDSDVTEYAYRHLFDQCDLEKDVTLRSIFYLINKHAEIFNLVFPCWVDEYLAEALSGTGKPYTGKYDPDAIEWLELYWHFEQTTYEKNEFPKEFHGHHFPSFGGTGFELKEEHEYHKVGSRIPWGISFTPVSDLINIPVKLKTNAEITDFDMNKDPKRLIGALGKLEGVTYTLGHILFGILWEISWHGSPEKRDKLGDELKQQVDDIKNGTAKLIPFDEALNEKTKKEDV